MDKDGFTPQLRTTVFQAVTGRGGDVSGQVGGDVRGMLIAAFGEGPRGGVNTRAAAAALGVTQRTVQRWIAGDQRQHYRPSPTHVKALAGRARQAATTKRGRRASVAAARKGSLARYGAKLTIRGEQGPRRAGTDYRRFRRIDLVLDPEQVRAMWDAYEAGGDKGFVTWLEGHADQAYLDDWGFGSIASLELGDPREPGGH